MSLAKQLTRPVRNREAPPTEPQLAWHLEERREEKNMAMQARISTIEGDGGKLDDALSVINEKVLPALKDLKGFTAANFLVDRSAGKLVAVAFYADEAALEGSVEAVGYMRDEVADVMGGKVVSVESYELVAQSW
jgi:hypothetical protein